MKINFVKMNGCGNDFAVFDRRGNDFNFKANQIAELANYKKSIGFDQLIILDYSKISDVKVTFYNNDGSIASACGNGTRCVAKIITDQLNKQVVTLEINNRIIMAQKKQESFSINMGQGKIISKINLDITYGVLVDVGNMHFVCAEPDDFDIKLMGPKLEKHPQFAERVNVNFTKIISKSKIILNTWERGAGETFSCGTGACASFFALFKENLVDNYIEVIQKGGVLLLALNQAREIIMTGDANINYFGSIDI